MRGRKPKPNAQQIAEGDPRKRGVNKLQERLEAEPKAVSGYPPCPEHLTGIARDTWHFLAEQIEIMGLDKRPDAMMLEGACVNYARAVIADQQIAREGITFTESTVDEESGEVVPLKARVNPAVTISNQAWQNLRSFGSEFGLSPASRTRLTIEKKDDAETDLAAALLAPRQPRSLPVN